MKNPVDPRSARGGISEPGERDTRLDPVEDMPDETQPGVTASPATTDPAPPHLPPASVSPPTVMELEAARPRFDSLVQPVDVQRSEPPLAGEAFRARAPRLRTGWPFLPVAPLLVVVVGLGVALGIGLVGLDQLSRAGDEHAGVRAELLAATVAARLGVLPPERRVDATRLAARRSAAELLVVTGQGEIIHDQTLGAPDQSSLRKMLASGSGVAEMRMGRARYAVRAIGPPNDRNAPRLVVLVPEPRAAASANALASALAALAVLLLGVAAGVAYAVSRDVVRDVEFVTHRVRTMAQVRTEPTGELIPARTMDEVGILTATFNKLVGRFGIASGRYRGDLVRASASRCAEVP